MRARFRNEEDFKKWMRRLALLTTAACGRVEQSELSVIPDAKIVVARQRPDGGVPDGGLLDAGCGPIDPVLLGYAFCGEVVTADCVHHQFDAARADAGCDSDCNFMQFGLAGCERADTGQSICWYYCGVGRLTDGVQTRACGVGALGSELANMASHEAGAALAFAQLERELERHGVSPQFSKRARRAAREEVRHARLVGSLARAHGGNFSVTRPIDSQRTLEALALENATEGCVRETLGALIGLHQSRHASDASVRAVMREVSRDELGHASWSHALAAQLDGQLSLAARRRVREAREVALVSATQELCSAPARETDVMLGLPDAERVQTLSGLLEQRAWL